MAVSSCSSSSSHPHHHPHDAIQTIQTTTTTISQKQDTLIDTIRENMCVRKSHRILHPTSMFRSMIVLLLLLHVLLTTDNIVVEAATGNSTFTLTNLPTTLFSLQSTSSVTVQPNGVPNGNVTVNFITTGPITVTPSNRTFVSNTSSTITLTALAGSGTATIKVKVVSGSGFLDSIDYTLTIQPKSVFTLVDVPSTLYSLQSSSNFSVQPNAAPAGNVIVTYTITGPITVAPTTHTFTANVSKSIVVTATAATGAATIKVNVSGGNASVGFSDSISYSITILPRSQLTISLPSTLMVGSTLPSQSVSLNAAPTGSVNVTLVKSGPIVVSPSTMAFTTSATQNLALSSTTVVGNATLQAMVVAGVGDAAHFADSIVYTITIQGSINLTGIPTTMPISTTSTPITISINAAPINTLTVRLICTGPIGLDTYNFVFTPTNYLTNQQALITSTASVGVGTIQAIAYSGDTIFFQPSSLVTLQVQSSVTLVGLPTVMYPGQLFTSVTLVPGGGGPINSGMVQITLVCTGDITPSVSIFNFTTSSSQTFSLQAGTNLGPITIQARVSGGNDAIHFSDSSIYNSTLDPQSQFTISTVPSSLYQTESSPTLSVQPNATPSAPLNVTLVITGPIRVTKTWFVFTNSNTQTFDLTGMTDTFGNATLQVQVHTKSGTDRFHFLSSNLYTITILKQETFTITGVPSSLYHSEPTSFLVTPTAAPNVGKSVVLYIVPTRGTLSGSPITFQEDGAGQSVQFTAPDSGSLDGVNFTCYTGSSSDQIHYRSQPTVCPFLIAIKSRANFTIPSMPTTMYTSQVLSWSVLPSDVPGTGGVQIALSVPVGGGTLSTTSMTFTTKTAQTLTYTAPDNVDTILISLTIVPTNDYRHFIDSNFQSIIILSRSRFNFTGLPTSLYTDEVYVGTIINPNAVASGTVTVTIPTVNVTYTPAGSKSWTNTSVGTSITLTANSLPGLATIRIVVTQGTGDFAHYLDSFEQTITIKPRWAFNITSYRERIYPSQSFTFNVYPLEAPNTPNAAILNLWASSGYISPSQRTFNYTGGVTPQSYVYTAPSSPSSSGLDVATCQVTGTDEPHYICPPQTSRQVLILPEVCSSYRDCTSCVNNTLHADTSLCGWDIPNQRCIAGLNPLTQRTQSDDGTAVGANWNFDSPSSCRPIGITTIAPTVGLWSNGGGVLVNFFGTFGTKANFLGAYYSLIAPNTNPSAGSIVWTRCDNLGTAIGWKVSSIECYVPCPGSTYTSGMGSFIFKVSSNSGEATTNLYTPNSHLIFTRSLVQVFPVSTSTILANWLTLNRVYGQAALRTYRVLLSRTDFATGAIGNTLSIALNWVQGIGSTYSSATLSYRYYSWSNPASHNAIQASMTPISFSARGSSDDTSLHYGSGSASTVFHSQPIDWCIPASGPLYDLLLTLVVPAQSHITTLQYPTGQYVWYIPQNDTMEWNWARKGYSISTMTNVYAFGANVQSLDTTVTCPNQPLLTNVTPPMGFTMIATTVTLTGTNFPVGDSSKVTISYGGDGGTSAYFSGEGRLCTNVTVISTTELQCRVANDITPASYISFTLFYRGLIANLTDGIYYTVAQSAIKLLSPPTQLYTNEVRTFQIAPNNAPPFGVNVSIATRYGTIAYTAPSGPTIYFPPGSTAAVSFVYTAGPIPNVTEVFTFSIIGRDAILYDAMYPHNVSLLLQSRVQFSDTWPSITYTNQIIPLTLAPWEAPVGTVSVTLATTFGTLSTTSFSYTSTAARSLTFTAPSSVPAVGYVNITITVNPTGDQWHYVRTLLKQLWIYPQVTFDIANYPTYLYVKQQVLLGYTPQQAVNSSFGAAVSATLTTTSGTLQYSPIVFPAGSIAQQTILYIAPSSGSTVDFTFTLVQSGDWNHFYSPTHAQVSLRAQATITIGTTPTSLYTGQPLTGLTFTISQAPSGTTPTVTFDIVTTGPITASATSLTFTSTAAQSITITPSATLTGTSTITAIVQRKDDFWHYANATAKSITILARSTFILSGNLSFLYTSQPMTLSIRPADAVNTGKSIDLLVTLNAGTASVSTLTFPSASTAAVTTVITAPSLGYAQSNIVINFTRQSASTDFYHYADASWSPLIVPIVPQVTWIVQGVPSFLYVNQLCTNITVTPQVAPTSGIATSLLSLTPASASGTITPTTISFAQGSVATRTFNYTAPASVPTGSTVTISMTIQTGGAYYQYFNPTFPSILIVAQSTFTYTSVPTSLYQSEASVAIAIAPIQVPNGIVTIALVTSANLLVSPSTMTFNNSNAPQTIILTATDTIGTATIQARVIDGSDMAHYANGPTTSLTILQRYSFNLAGNTSTLFTSQPLTMTIAAQQAVNTGKTILLDMSASPSGGTLSGFPMTILPGDGTNTKTFSYIAPTTGFEGWITFTTTIIGGTDMAHYTTPVWNIFKIYIRPRATFTLSVVTPSPFVNILYVNQTAEIRITPTESPSSSVRLEASINSTGSAYTIGSFAPTFLVFTSMTPRSFFYTAPSAVPTFVNNALSLIFTVTQGGSDDFYHYLPSPLITQVLNFIDVLTFQARVFDAVNPATMTMPLITSPTFHTNVSNYQSTVVYRWSDMRFTVTFGQTNSVSYRFNSGSSVTLSSGVESVSLRLLPNATNNLVITSLQGNDINGRPNVYNISIIRGPTDLFGFIGRITSDSGPTFAGTGSFLNWSPNTFIPGTILNYSTSVPFIVTRITVAVTYATASTVAIDFGPVTSAVPIASGIPSDPLSLVVGTSLVHLQSSIDGIYQLSIVRNPPDITYLPSSSAPRLVGYSSITGLTYTVALQPAWDPTVLNYRANVPRVVDRIALDITFATPTKASIGFEPARVGGGAVVVTPQTFVSGNMSQTTFDLELGSNMLRLNHTLDGFYNFNVTRFERDVASVRFQVRNIEGVVTNPPFESILTPEFVGGQFVPYEITLPYMYGGVALAVFFGTQHTVSIYYSSSSTLDRFVTLVDESLVSGAFTNMITLPDSTLTQTNVIIRVASREDANYTIVCKRSQPDLTNVVLTVGRVDYYSVAQREVINGVNTFTPSLTKRNYTLNVTYSWSQLFLSATFNISGSVSLTVNSSTGISLSSKVEQGPYPLQVGSNVLRINSTRDGTYIFTVMRAAPDVRDIRFTLFGDTAGVLYNGDGIGGSFGGISPPFTPGQALAYTATVPYRIWSMTVQVDFSWIVSSTTVDNNFQGSTLQSLISGQSSQPIPLQVGINAIHINSTHDGVYTINIVREAPDVAGIVVYGSTTLENQVKDWNTTLPNSLQPTFVPGVFDTSRLILPYVYNLLRLAFSFSSPTSLTLESQWLNDSVVSRIAPVDLLNGRLTNSIPLRVGDTKFVLRSAKDGNYSFIITRQVMDISVIEFNGVYSDRLSGSLVIRSFDQLNSDLSLGLGMNYSYTLSVPFVYRSLRVRASFVSSVIFQSVSDSDSNRMDLMSQVWSLPDSSLSIDPSLNRFQLLSEADGNYSFIIIRESVDLTLVELWGTYLSDDSSQVSIPLVLSSPTAPSVPIEFQPGVIFEYEISVPFVVSGVQVRVTFKSADSVDLLWNSVPQPTVNSDMVFDFPLLTQPDANLMTIIAYRDGNYTFNIKRSIPDLTEITLTGCSIDTLTGVTTFHPLTLDTPFGPTNTSYNLTVPFTISSVIMRVVYTTSNVVVTLESNQGSSEVVVSSGVPTDPYQLLPGNEDTPHILHLMTPYDGNRTYTFVRLEMDLQSIDMFGSYGTSSSSEEGPFEIVNLPNPLVYKPEFIPGSSWSFRITLPYLLSNFTLRLTFTDRQVSRVTPTMVNSGLMGSSLDNNENGVTSFNWWIEGTPQTVSSMTSGIATPSTVLSAGVTTLIRIQSPFDGNFSLSITRLAPQLREINFKSTYPTSDGLEIIHDESINSFLSPHTFVGGAIYSYSLILPFKFASIAFETIFDSIGDGGSGLWGSADGSNHTVTWTIDDAPPVMSESGVQTSYMNLTCGSTYVLRVNSNQDGNYTIPLVRNCKDVSNITFNLLDRLGMTSSLNLTDFYTNDGGLPGVYSFVLPYRIVSLTFLATSETQINGGGDPSWKIMFNNLPLQPTFTSGIPSSTLTMKGFVPQVNIFEIRSELDGNYTFRFTRSYQDVTNITVIGLTPGGEIDILRRQFKPLQGIFSYSVEARADVTSIAYMVMYSTPFEDGLVTSSWDGVLEEPSLESSTFSDWKMITPGRNTLLYVDSIEDGRYTINITLPLAVFEPCANNGIPRCKNGGTCSPQYSNSSYVCICTYGFYGSDCSDSDYVQTIPPTVTRPVAVLSCPTTVTECGTLELRGDGSQGFGTDVANAVYAWSITEIRQKQIDLLNFTALTSEQLEYAHSLNTSIGVNLGTFLLGESVVQIPSYQLCEECSYTFTLWVGDSNQWSQLPASCVVQKMNATNVAWLPQLTIVAPNVIKRSTVTPFYVSILPSSCAPLPSDVLYIFNWTVVSVTGSPFTRSFSDRNLLVPIDTFQAGRTYRVQLELTLSSASAGSIATSRRLLAAMVGVASSTREITVASTPLTAAIVGGDRQKSIDQAITIDASGSRDPDYDGPTPTSSDPASYPFAFAWTCSMKPTAGGAASPCGMTLETALPILTIPSNTLTADQTYTFRVTILSSDNRTATSSVDVYTVGVPIVPLPIVTIVDAPTYTNPTSVLTLTGRVQSINAATPSAALTCIWSVTPYLNLTNPSLLSSDVNGRNLVLKANTLSPGLYTFRLTVTDPNTLASSFASVNIFVNTPPSGGDCTITPTTGGEALVTLFTIACSRWYSPQGQDPLTYAVQYATVSSSDDTNQPSSSSQWLSQYSPSSILTTTLPGGPLRIFILIRDQLDALTRYELYINVGRSNTSLNDPCGYVRNTTITSLLPALASQSIDAALLLINELSVILNTAGPPDTICDAASGDHTVSTVEATRNTLLTSLSSITNSTILTPELTSLIIQGLESLTSGQGSMNNTLGWNLASEILITSMKHVPTTNMGGIDREQMLTSLATVISNLLVDCTRLDVAGQLMQQLLTKLLDGFVVGQASSTFNTTNIHATVTRNDVVAGTAIKVGGIYISLTADAFTQFAQELGLIDSNNVDTASNSTSLTLALDTRIVTFDTRWSKCRTSGDIYSDLTQIDITLSDGTIVDISNLRAPINFILPFNGNQSETNRTTKVVECVTSLNTTADNLSDTNDTQTGYVCSFYNPLTTLWSTQGCVTQGLTADRKGINCSCGHLTEFAILYREARAAAAGLCGDVDTSLGSWQYLLFASLYGLVFIIATSQSIRILSSTGCTHWLMAVEHMLVSGQAAFRGLNMMVFYVLYRHFDITTQSLIAAIPHIFTSWIYTFVIFAWASIYHSALSGKHVTNPFKGYQFIFVTLNTLIGGSLFAVFTYMAYSSGDLEMQEKYFQIGVRIIAVVAILLAIFFMVYGTLLVRTLTKDFASPYARKLFSVAVLLSLALACSSCVLLISGVDANFYNERLEMYNAIYFSLDIFCLCIVMFLFAKSVSSSLAGSRLRKKTDVYSVNNTRSNNKVVETSLTGTDNTTTGTKTVQAKIHASEKPMIHEEDEDDETSPYDKDDTDAVVEETANQSSFRGPVRVHVSRMPTPDGSGFATPIVTRDDDDGEDDAGITVIDAGDSNHPRVVSPVLVGEGGTWATRAGTPTGTPRVHDSPTATPALRPAGNVTYDVEDSDEEEAVINSRRGSRRNSRRGSWALDGGWATPQLGPTLMAPAGSPSKIEQPSRSPSRIPSRVPSRVPSRAQSRAPSRSPSPGPAPVGVSAAASFLNPHRVTRLTAGEVNNERGHVRHRSLDVSNLIGSELLPERRSRSPSPSPVAVPPRRGSGIVSGTTFLNPRAVTRGFNGTGGSSTDATIKPHQRNRSMDISFQRVSVHREDESTTPPQQDEKNDSKGSSGRSSLNGFDINGGSGGGDVLPGTPAMSTNVSRANSRPNSREGSRRGSEGLPATELSIDMEQIPTYEDPYRVIKHIPSTAASSSSKAHPYRARPGSDGLTMIAPNHPFSRPGVHAIAAQNVTPSGRSMVAGSPSASPASDGPKGGFMHLPPTVPRPPRAPHANNLMGDASPTTNNTQSYAPSVTRGHVSSPSSPQLASSGPKSPDGSTGSSVNDHFMLPVGRSAASRARHSAPRGGVAAALAYAAPRLNELRPSSGPVMRHAQPMIQVTVDRDGDDDDDDHQPAPVSVTIIPPTPKFAKKDLSTHSTGGASLAPPSAASSSTATSMSMMDVESENADSGPSATEIANYHHPSKIAR